MQEIKSPAWKRARSKMHAALDRGGQKIQFKREHIGGCMGHTMACTSRHEMMHRRRSCAQEDAVLTVCSSSGKRGAERGQQACFLFIRVSRCVCCAVLCCAVRAACGAEDAWMHAGMGVRPCCAWSGSIALRVCVRMHQTQRTRASLSSQRTGRTGGAMIAEIFDIVAVLH